MGSSDRMKDGEEWMWDPERRQRGGGSLYFEEEEVKECE